MLVSVIIPTYKPANYFEQCLRSLNQQTIDSSQLEIIIVLNGCREPWLSYIDIAIKKNISNLQVKLIQTDIPGVSNARNIGIDKSKGDYITFIDDDDYISPKYLEELLKNSSEDCMGLTDSIYFQDENHKLIYDNIHHNDYIRLKNIHNPTLYQSRRFFNGPVMKLIHRNIIGNRRFDVHFANGEDSLFMALISDRIKHCRFCISDAIYYRRIRPNSATTSKKSFLNKLINNLNRIVQYCKYWIKNPLKYNVSFMISRILASVKNLVVG